MLKINKSVELVTTTIKSLSSMSLPSRLDAKAVLEQKYKHVRITDIRSAKDLDAVVARRPDLVFLGMKFIPDGSKPVWLSEYFSIAGIPFTGSGRAASECEHNKFLSKQRVSESGLKTAQSILIKKDETYEANNINIPYPIFVKPVDGGGGSGINDNSVVRNFEELKAQVKWLFDNCQTDALLETYLPGREFSVGVLKKRFSSGYHLLPLEIVAPEVKDGSRFLSCRVKRQDEEQTHAVVDPAIRRKINDLALGSFKALGSSDYGRIDIRMDEAGEPHFLEANLLPSLLKDYGNLPKAAELNIGLPYKDLIFKIADLGLARKSMHAIAVDSQDADILQAHSLPV